MHQYNLDVTDNVFLPEIEGLKIALAASQVDEPAVLLRECPGRGYQ